MNSTVRRTVLAGMALSIGGCLSRSTSGDDVTYRISPRFIGGLFALAAALAVVGHFSFRSKNALGPRIGAILVLLVPVAALPAIAGVREYVTLNDEIAEFNDNGVVRVVYFADRQRFEFRVKRAFKPLYREIVVPTFILSRGKTVELTGWISSEIVIDDLIERLKKAGVPVVGDR